MATAVLTTEGTTDALRRQVRLRAEWLDSLSAADRDALGDAPLREVDAGFDAWLRVRRAVGHDGGG